jgi:hypothetical protein
MRFFLKKEAKAFLLMRSGPASQQRPEADIARQAHPAFFGTGGRGAELIGGRLVAAGREGVVVVVQRRPMMRQPAAGFHRRQANA